MIGNYIVEILFRHNQEQYKKVYKYKNIEMYLAVEKAKETFKKDFDNEHEINIEGFRVETCKLSH